MRNGVSNPIISRKSPNTTDILAAVMAFGSGHSFTDELFRTLLNYKNKPATRRQRLIALWDTLNDQDIEKIESRFDDVADYWVFASLCEEIEIEARPENRGRL